MAKHQVVYVPGLGDSSYMWQRWLLSLWRPLGLRVNFLAIKWGDGRPFKTKLNQAVRLIDELSQNGDKIAIVGVSAGASAAINIYLKCPDKISSVILICGKVRGSENVNRRYFERNPAFKESLIASEHEVESLLPTDRAKILCLKAAHDSLLIAEDSVIAGARIKTIPAIGHLPAIVYALSAGAPQIARFIRRKESLR